MRTPLRRYVVPDRNGDEEIRPCGSCLRCVSICPTGALQYHDRVWSLDLGLCRYCRECAYVCPNSLITEELPS
ncbi:MAG TPA: 4Fe-4S dicluster domain-containing protein [Symbiobacteriaceae bacterium]|nr:4Fe-4S dicluster domain-containing protein [Symbiobacteriaceae bacterium]